MEHHWSVSRRSLAAGALLLCSLVAVAATPQLLGTRVEGALDTIARADPRLLWLAALGIALGVVGSAGSWRSVIGLCGGRASLTEATARYGAGSFVNTLLPFRAGDAVRLGLFSRLLPGEQRLRTTGGAFAALGAARAVVLGALVVAGAFAGAVPLWPLLVACVAAAAGIAAAVGARHSRAHLLDAFRALAESPAASIRLLAWIALSIAGRVAAATAVGAALGMSHPLTAAVLVVPAIDVAGIVPLTPGNVGLASAAVAVAYQAHGASFTHGLAAGVAFQGVETAVGLTVGIASLLWLAPYPSPGMRRVALGSVAAAGALGATALVSLL